MLVRIVHNRCYNLELFDLCGPGRLFIIMLLCVTYLNYVVLCDLFVSYVVLGDLILNYVLLGD